MFRNLLLVATLCFIGVPRDAWPIEPLKSPYRIRFGTLEWNSDIKRRYVFDWDAKEAEVFDFDPLGRSGIAFPGLPDLKETGIKTASGKIFKYGSLLMTRFFEGFSKEHPDEKVEALIFSGLLEEDLEIKIKGKTPVCRVDINLNGDKTTLWKNMPSHSADAAKGKSEK